MYSGKEVVTGSGEGFQGNGVLGYLGTIFFKL